MHNNPPYASEFSFNSTRYIRNLLRMGLTNQKRKTFNSTRYIRNYELYLHKNKEEGLSTPHGTLGTRVHGGDSQPVNGFQLHTVHQEQRFSLFRFSCRKSFNSTRYIRNSSPASFLPVLKGNFQLHTVHQEPTGSTGTILSLILSTPHGTLGTLLASP